MKNRIVKLTLVGMSILVVALSGCSANNADQKDSPEEITKEELSDKETSSEEGENSSSDEEELKILGTEDDAVEKSRLKNSTGKGIKAFAVKKTEEQEYQQSLLAENDTFAADETRYLYFKAEENAVQENPAEDEKALTQGYDVQLTLEDDTVYVLHYFPFIDMEEGEILIEDNVAYLKFLSRMNEETLETKEAEIAIREQEAAAEAQRQAEAAAAAEAQRQAEAAAAAEAQRQAEAAAAAEAQRQAEAAAAAEAQRRAQEEAQRQAQQQQQNDWGGGGCLDSGLVY